MHEYHFPVYVYRLACVSSNVCNSTNRNSNHRKLNAGEGVGEGQIR